MPLIERDPPHHALEAGDIRYDFRPSLPEDDNHTVIVVTRGAVRSQSCETTAHARDLYGRLLRAGYRKC